MLERVGVGRLGPDRELDAFALHLAGELAQRAEDEGAVLRIPALERRHGLIDEADAHGGERLGFLGDRSNAERAVDRQQRKERDGRERGASRRAEAQRGGGAGGSVGSGEAPRSARAARQIKAAPTAKIAETPRSPTRSASWTNTGQGLTSPAGVQANTVGSETAT